MLVRASYYFACCRFITMQRSFQELRMALLADTMPPTRLQSRQLSKRLPWCLTGSTDSWNEKYLIMQVMYCFSHPNKIYLLLIKLTQLAIYADNVTMVCMLTFVIIYLHWYSICMLWLFSRKNIYCECLCCFTKRNFHQLTLYLSIPNYQCTNALVIASLNMQTIGCLYVLFIFMCYKIVFQ
jgi:hypothetical protein